ncbi:MAG TPA: response regulator [Tepidisphaeraceae bacterium]|nr:response regulator [Tepidisphaeraceae bacterium]
MKHRETTLLIVDDSATTRNMIQRVIGMAGMPVGRIEQAADGQAALEIMSATTVDLVLADLNMPVMDGFEMIRRMRKSDSLRFIPVVVISAQPDTEQIAQLKREGVAAYLPKPFTPEGVRELIEPLLLGEHTHHASPQRFDATFNLNLAEALSEALETMAVVSPEMKPDAKAPENAVLVKVEFHGAGGTGYLTLAAAREFGTLVAANCNAEASAIEGEDALKELANVTCGLLLRKRIGGAAGFELLPPVLVQEHDLESPWDCDVVRFSAEGFTIIARVTSDWNATVMETAT